MVEHVASPARDEQVVEAVVVVVADAAGLPPTGVGQAGFARDIGKRAVAIVVEEIAGGLAAGGGGIEGGTVDQEDIEPAVVIVVDEGDAAAHLFDQILLVLRRAGNVAGVAEARGGGDIGELRGGCSAGDQPGGRCREMPGAAHGALDSLRLPSRDRPSGTRGASAPARWTRDPA